VGKRKNELRQRFYGHRGDMKKECEDSPTYHFRINGHKAEDMKVVGLERVPGRDNIYRIAQERWWMRKMGVLREENRRW
jgi:hypothetical protein